MNRVTVGNVEIIALSDMLFPSPPEQVYTEAGAALEQYRSLLDASGNLPLNCASFLLRADGRTVLVDTGNGPEAQGNLLTELEATGVPPSDIDVVVFTHLHGDHTGFNLEREPVAPRFSRARYLVPQGDWDHYRAEAPESFTRDVAPLEGLGVLDLFEGEREITPSIVTLPAPGHTPGHTALVVRSGGEEGYIIGDAFISPVDVAEPDWVTAWDWNGDLVRSTRHMLAQRIEAANALVAAAHLPVPSLGRFVMTAGKRTWRGAYLD